MKRPGRVLVLLPLLLAAGLVAGYLLQGREPWHEPAEIASPLVGHVAPSFSLPVLDVAAATPEAARVAASLAPGAASLAAAAASAGRFSPADLRGRPWVLNVFASWCTGCRDEHALLVRAARESGVTLVGLDVDDRPEDARGWLAGAGNPYAVVARDDAGRVGVDYDVRGVPETFVIDRDGVVRLKLVGALKASTWNERVRPLLVAGVAVPAPASAPASTTALTAPTAPTASRPDPAVEARLLALARELRCLVCQNESLADSQAGLAQDLRREMRALIVAGRSDAEIIDFLVGRYGDFVRYRPPLAPRTWLLWGGPALGAIAGAIVLARVVRRRRAMPDRPLDADERARLAVLLSEDEG